MSENFKVGDIVVCIKAYESRVEALNNVGVVIWTRRDIIDVEFYKNINGHNGIGSTGKREHCWGFDSNRTGYLKKIKTNQKK